MAYIGSGPTRFNTADELTVTGDANIDTDTLVVDADNNRVGIGTSSPLKPLTIESSAENTPLDVYRDSTGIVFIRLRNNDGSAFIGAEDYLDFYTGGDASGSNSSRKMRIDSSGNVGIGTDSPNRMVTIGDGTQGAADLSLTASNDSISTVYFADGDDANVGYAQYDHTGNSLRIGVNNAERMRIDSSGIVMVGTTANSFSSASLQVGDVDIAGSNSESGWAANIGGAVRHSGPFSTAYYINDSSSSAGTHNYIIFRYQGSTIGDIDTTNNATIRYNTFTGGHWTQFEDGTQPTLPLGTVLSTIDDLLQWTEYEYTNEDGQTEKTTVAGFDTIGETKTIYIDEDGATAEGTALSHDTAQRIAKCKVSDVEGDKCVYGVFAGHYKDGDSSVESLGLGIIRIGSGVTVQRGDLLESAGDGTARPQTGDTADLFKAGTIAKVTSTTVVETYDDGSYTVPCTLHCG